MDADQSSTKKVPITRIVLLLFGGMLLLLCSGGFFFADYYSFSASSCYFPSGMEVTAKTRGFGGGGTAVDYRKESNSITATVADHEYVVSPQEVRADGMPVISIPAGTKSLEIVTYWGTVEVVADGKTLHSTKE